jgi:hypothetical protein
VVVFVHKKKKVAPFSKNHACPSLRDRSMAVAGQYDAGHPDVILLRVEHQK